MNKFSVSVETTRAENYVIRYRDGTRLPNGKLKKIPYAYVDKTQTGMVDGETHTGKHLANALAEKLKENKLLGKFQIVNTSFALPELIDQFLADREKQRDLSWLSRRQYRINADRLLEYFQKLEDLAQREKMYEWKHHLKSLEYKDITVHGLLTFASMFCKWLVIKKRIEQSPFLEGQVMSAPEPKPRFWKLADFAAAEHVAGSFDYELQIGMHLAHDFGLRTVEIVGDGVERLTGVQWEDLTWNEDGTVDLLVRAEVTKGRKDKRKSRLLRLTPEFVELLGSRKTGPLVSIKRAVFGYAIGKVQKLAGLKERRTVHGLRHSFGKNSIQGGGDLKALQKNLGHKHVGTTEIYSETEQKYLAAQMEKTHAYVRKELAIAKTLQGKTTSFSPEVINSSEQFKADKNNDKSENQAKK